MRRVVPGLAILLGVVLARHAGAQSRPFAPPPPRQLHLGPLAPPTPPAHAPELETDLRAHFGVERAA